MYNSYRVRKPRGGFRQITEPQEELKALLSFIADSLAWIPLHNACHGFVYNKSPVTNAAVHRNQQYVLNLDIKDFFPSVLHDPMMETISYWINTSILPPHYYDWISHLCFHNGCLPQGSPASPVLSNIYMYTSDIKLSHLADTYALKYSRYADDLTFSGGVYLKDNLAEFISYVSSIVQSKGLRLNKKKIKLMPYYQCQKVTGIVVNNTKLTLPGRRREELFVSLRGTSIKDLDESMLGYLEYVRSVDSSFYDKLIRHMN